MTSSPNLPDALSSVRQYKACVRNDDGVSGFLFVVLRLIIYPFLKIRKHLFIFDISLHVGERCMLVVVRARKSKLSSRVFVSFRTFIFPKKKEK